MLCIQRKDEVGFFFSFSLLFIVNYHVIIEPLTFMMNMLRVILSVMMMNMMMMS